MLKYLVTTTFSLLVSSAFFSQCILETTVNSTQGYSVNVAMTLNTIIAPQGNCVNGYNFNVQFSYNISFSGNNPPASLYTLQGNITCGSHNNNFFNLPNAGGQGNGVSTGNSWRAISDCQTATVQSLNCNQIDLIIQGPGIPYQVIPLNCISILPIELAYFQVEETEQGVELNWLSLTELNNDYFEILKSNDGKTWNVINQIKGSGTTNSPTHYEWIDDSRVSSSTSYYRLKQVDFDGASTLYDIKMVSHKEFDWFLAPNPAKTSTVIHMAGNIELEEFIIVNMQGREINFQNLVQSANDSKVTLDISVLPRGLYLVIANGLTQKLIID